MAPRLTRATDRSEKRQRKGHDQEEEHPLDCDHRESEVNIRGEHLKVLQTDEIRFAHQTNR
jgi:hypothetical protein